MVTYINIYSKERPVKIFYLVKRCKLVSRMILGWETRIRPLLGEKIFWKIRVFWPQSALDNLDGHF